MIWSLLFQYPTTEFSLWTQQWYCFNVHHSCKLGSLECRTSKSLTMWNIGWFIHFYHLTFTHYYKSGGFKSTHNRIGTINKALYGILVTDESYHMIVWTSQNKVKRKANIIYIITPLLLLGNDLISKSLSHCTRLFFFAYQITYSNVLVCVCI